MDVATEQTPKTRMAGGARAADATQHRAKAPKAAGPASAPRSASLEPLKRGEIELAEFRNCDWCGVACAGAQPEDYEDPAMWTAIGDGVNLYDIVRIVARDSTWWAMYLIVDAQKTRTAAKLLMATALPKYNLQGEALLPEGYRVRPGDPSEEPWCVERVADGLVMNRNLGHKTHEEARRWLLDHAIFRDDTRPVYLP